MGSSRSRASRDPRHVDTNQPPSTETGRSNGIAHSATNGHSCETGRSNGTDHSATNGDMISSNKNAQSNWPKRSFMDDPLIKWRLGHAPDYSRVDKQFMAEKKMNHPPGSLEETVENLVKTWEMEASHKLDPRQWQTVDYDAYQVVINGMYSFNIEEAAQQGTYNLLMPDSPYYDAKSHTFESSHHLFREAFNESFPWEVMAVLSGPPKVTFSWRHWGLWSGKYNDTPPSNKIVETFGICIAHVNEDLKIGKLEVYYDSNHFLRKFTEGSRDKCPFLHAE